MAGHCAPWTAATPPTSSTPWPSPGTGPASSPCPDPAGCQDPAAYALARRSMTLARSPSGPGHQMDWMTGITFRPGLIGEYVTTTGAVLAGRDGWDHATSDSRPYGGAWDGPI